MAEITSKFNDLYLINIKYKLSLILPNISIYAIALSSHLISHNFIFCFPIFNFEFLQGLTAIRDLKAREAGVTVAAVAGTAGTAAVELAESKEADVESTGKK